MRLLIVGSLEGHMITAGKIAFERGAKVATVDDVDQAMSSLRTGNGADLIMVDINLDIDKLCKHLDMERFSVPVIACGIGTQPSKAGDAIRSGAKEYIPLPPDAELIAAVLAAVTEETNSLIYKDPAMAAVIQFANQIAPSDASVLITGESGTGKEVMSRYLHSKSRRAKNNFISINCAAIPENLLESELFGHEKGAFTGALSRRVGKFEEANGGTLLLDEISEMHPRLQAKLLRAVQEREIDRVGGNKPIKVDIRLLATSNRNMEEEVKKGNFREDLYYRLNVVTIDMPSLRDRPLDIELLADHFLAKYAESNGVAKPAITPEALTQLMQHHWRGNVRELENTMHRAVLLSRDNIVGPEAIMLTGTSFAPVATQAPIPVTQGYPTTPASHQPPQRQQPSAQQPAPGTETPEKALVGRTVADVEKDLILNTLQHCLGNRTHAANILGISIRTLRNKLKIYSDDGTEVTSPGRGGEVFSPSL
ncbi:MAG: sigma-54 dependent transcriptional regulator [Halopseudomonas aestusnigri]